MADAAAIQREMFDAIRRSGWDTLRSLYHDDYVYRGEDGTEQKGRDAGLAVAQTYMTAFPDLSFDVQQQWTASDDASLCSNASTAERTRLTWMESRVLASGSKCPTAT